MVENDEIIESINASERGMWKKNWWITVNPNFVLVTRNVFTGKIKAVVVDEEIPRSQKLVVGDPNSFVSRFQFKLNPNESLGYVAKYYLLGEASPKLLKKLRDYYTQTSRDLEVDRIDLEIRYRNFIYEKSSNSDEYAEAVKSRKYIDSPELLEYLGITKNPEQLDLISNAYYKFYRREYGNVIVNIPKKKAKEGLRLRLPFQQVMLVSLTPIQLNTTRIEIGVSRRISYDIDPRVVICDPKTFVKLLQSDTYNYDKNKIFEDVLVQINKACYNYFSTRIEVVKDVKKLQEKSKKDKDLLWDLAKIGKDFGIEFVEISVRVYDSEKVLAANDEKKSMEIKTQAELDRIRRLRDEENISSNLSFITGLSNGSNGNGSMSINDILGYGFAQQLINNPNGGLFGGQPAPQQKTNPAPTVTASGLSIEYLYRQGICDENGNLDFDVINEILVERGLAEGSQILGAEDLTRDEAFKIFNKVKGKRN